MDTSTLLILATIVFAVVVTVILAFSYGAHRNDRSR